MIKDIEMSNKLFFKIRSNIKKASGEYDTGYYTEDDEKFVLIFYVKNYFAKTIILKEDLGKLVNTDSAEILNRPVYFENNDLNVEEFKRKFLHDFEKVISF